jgi:lysyl oxidase
MGINRRLPTLRRPGIAAWTAFLVAGLVATGTSTMALAAPQGGRSAASQRAAASLLAAERADGPQLRLIAAQRQTEAYRYGKQPVFFDPGIWVASLHGAFQIDVSRASYTKPVRATQIIRTSGGTIFRPLESSVVAAGWAGLRHFLQLTVRNARGRVVGHSQLTFCPAPGYDAGKATPDSAATDPYPQQCTTSDPFPLGEIWGLARGWAVDPAGYVAYKLSPGRYTVTETISPQYVRTFGIGRADATATIRMKVVEAKQCCIAAARTAAPLPAGFVRVHSAPPAARPGAPTNASTALLTHVPPDALPDLIPLPSWGISVANGKKTSFLDFGATVWISGNSPLDVEGYRVAGTSTMQAYQYFYANGKKLIGRMRVGTMGFASYNAWHFNQFAQYFLLSKHKKVVVRSRKVGFCIAPTDGVDMLLPHATWVPSYTGIEGNCGDPSALWATEILPIGWGDTYVQTVPYQSFDISKIPNGTYYIEIVANPEHLLHELSTANDVSLREVIISGTKGHRTVRVPAWHGIDPENGRGFGYPPAG